MARTKRKIEPNVCPECGQTSGDLRWPVLTLREGCGGDFLFCMNCGWDSFPDTRKMSRETYEYFWQRYRLMWGRTIKARPMTRGYHAPQHMVNFMRSFICPKWMSGHFHGATSWTAWEKHWREVEYPNNSLFSFWESRNYDPKLTMAEFLAQRKADPKPEPDYDSYGDYDYYEYPYYE